MLKTSRSDPSATDRKPDQRSGEQHSGTKAILETALRHHEGLHADSCPAQTQQKAGGNYDAQGSASRRPGRHAGTS
jgi:hypothetical protein